MKKTLLDILKIFNKQLFWLVLIISLGFLVRLYKINSPIADWHSWRQVDTASVTRIYLEQGFNFFLPRYYDVSSIQSGMFNPHAYRMVELPLFNLLHLGLFRLIPVLNFEAAGRMVSILAFCASAIFVYLLGKRFISPWGGVVAAFFFAFIPYNIFFTRVILPEELTVAFALASLWLFSLFIDSQKSKYLWLSGGLFAVAMLLKPYIGFYLFAPLYLILKKYGLKGLFSKPKLLIKLLIFSDIILIPFFAWRIWINRFPAGIPHFAWAFNGDGIRFHPAFWRWIFGERLGKLILGVWGLPLFVVGIFWSKSKNYFIHFFALGMLVYVSVVATANVRHDYYQIFTIPAISLAVANGAVWAIGSSKNKILAFVGMVFCIGMMFYLGLDQIKGDYNINHPEIIDAGSAVQRLTPKDSWVIAPYNGDTAFLYQTDRFGWPAVDDSFQKLIQKGADFYVSVNLGDADTNFIRQNYKVIEQTDKYMIADLHQALEK
jgi:hypothetical protein